MVLQFSDQLRYAAAAGILAVAWGYRKRKGAQCSETSETDSIGIPPFRKLEAAEVRQLQQGSVHRIGAVSCSDGLTCEVAVLGTASGGGTASLECLLNPERRCPVCTGSDKRNKRTPQSVMVRFSCPESDESFGVLVDCSQATKRQLCMARSLFGELRLDAVLLTSGQVDKYIGLNDLREVQQANKKDFRSGSGEVLPIYASCSAVATVKSTMPFLFSTTKKTKTLVAGLDARGVSERLGERVSTSSAVTIRTLPCKDEKLGFVFGRDEGCVVVLPDPNISPEAREWLAQRDVHLLLVGNAADRAELSACAQLVKAVKPRHAVITGLGCGLDHLTAEEMLQNEVGELSVSVAHDGMMLETKIADEDLTVDSLGECSCLSSGSTTTGGGSSGGESITDEDRCIGFSPTHGPSEGGVMDSNKEPLSPVALSALAQRTPRSP
jgi:hypothetical protein